MTTLTPKDGHGWVRPLPGGVKARCGGPGVCPQCNAEELQLVKDRMNDGQPLIAADASSRVYEESAIINLDAWAKLAISVTKPDSKVEGEDIQLSDVVHALVAILERAGDGATVGDVIARLEGKTTDQPATSRFNRWDAPTEAALMAANAAAVDKGLRAARSALQAGGIRHSWLDGYVAIAAQVAAYLERKA